MRAVWYSICMNRPNYNEICMKTAMEQKGKRLLLHCCCAPCSSACLERLNEYFKITVLFYNPNIEDPEYTHRKNELIRLIHETGWADIMDCDSDPKDYYDAVKGLENEPEGGKRCMKCFELRLKKTAELANAGGYDYFTTTLTLSPLKNAEAINEIGERAAQGGAAKWLPSDFKKKDGYLESIRLSEKYHLYRQNYCGCVFSMEKSVDN
ncbi:MAG: epoxyqueuosine reductase QueH [Clostridia bacterium]|nr:epoxyqueuosine reductase QueH [Clostridia bacterium]